MILGFVVAINREFGLVTVRDIVERNSQSLPIAACAMAFDRGFIDH
jgi:hypothetical protein